MGEVELADAYLEPRYENLAWCIRHLLPREVDRVLRDGDTKTQALHRGPTRLSTIRKVFENLQQQGIEYVPGAPLRLGPMLSQVDRRKFPAVEITDKPVLVFDPGGQRTSRWNQGGLDEHGPYDQRYFTPKRLRVALICQAAAQGQAEQFLNGFLEGLPDILKGSKAPYAKGFLRRYLLETA